jgi:hypothetical protein
VNYSLVFFSQARPNNDSVSEKNKIRSERKSVHRTFSCTKKKSVVTYDYNIIKKINIIIIYTLLCADSLHMIIDNIIIHINLFYVYV